MTHSQRNAYRGVSTLVAVSILTICIFANADWSFGQTPSPRLHFLYPNSGKVGTNVEVTIGGADLDEASQLIFSSPTIKAALKMSAATEMVPAKPIANQFTVTIPQDTQPGIYEVRALGRFGFSTPRRFVVGLENEVICNEQNKTFETAMPISVGSAVNGRATANAKQYFKFALKDQEKVTIECQTRAIDSKMDPVVIISDLSGKEIARSRSSNFQSPTIFFKAPRASQYIVEIRDAVFGGGTEFFYRLRVSNLPYISGVFPNVIQADVKQELTLYGWNLPGGIERTDSSRANQYFETTKKPSDEILQPKKNSGELPLQTNSFTLDWRSIAILDNGRIVSNLQPIYLASNPVTNEADEDEATLVTVPTDISGRFSPGTETDRYEFDAKKGEVFFVEVFSHRLGNDSDVILTLQQSVTSGEGVKTWNRVSVIDDVGNRAGTTGPDFSTSSDDPSMKIQIPADGRYRLILKDQFGNSDSGYRSAYRLSIRRPSPDFNLVCTPIYGHIANGNQILGNALVVTKGDRKSVRVSLDRVDDFSGSVEVTCENLPAGVTCNPITLSSSQASNEIVFSVSDDAANGKALIKIVGKAKIGDREVVREATPTVVTWDTGNKTTVPPHFRRTVGLEISVVSADIAPVSVDVGTGSVFETSLGGKIGIPIKLARRNFTEPIKLTATNLPANLKPADLTIPKEKSDGSVELYVKDKNTALGTYQFQFKGDAKFKHSRNPQAAAREQAEQARLEEVSKKFAADKTSLMSAMKVALQKLPMLDQLVTNAKSELEISRKTISEKSGQAARLSEAISKSKNSKTTDVDPLIFAAAEAQLKSLQAEVETQTSVGLKNLESKVKVAEKAKVDAAAEIESMKKRIADFDAKQKLIDAEKAASKKRFDALTKQSAAKDLIYKAISNPLTVKIVASPISISAVAEHAATIGSKTKLALSFSRKYGFAEAMTINLKAPNGVPGIVIPPITVPKDKNDATIEIEIQPNCPPGNHTIEIVASGKFNNVDVQTKSSFLIKVTAKPAS